MLTTDPLYEVLLKPRHGLCMHLEDVLEDCQLNEQERVTLRLLFLDTLEHGADLGYKAAHCDIDDGIPLQVRYTVESDAEA